MEDYRNGEKKTMGFLVDRTVRTTKGRADPAIVSRIIKKFLSAQ